MTADGTSFLVAVLAVVALVGGGGVTCGISFDTLQKVLLVKGRPNTLVFARDGSVRKIKCTIFPRAYLLVATAILRLNIVLFHFFSFFSLFLELRPKKKIQ